MPDAIATSLVHAIYAYCAAGVLLAVPFVVWGVAKIDHEAAGASWGFRAIIIPGVIALWPLLAFRWISGANVPPAQKDPHR